jgi:hypothetical protein
MVAGLYTTIAFVAGVICAGALDPDAVGPVVFGTDASNGAAVDGRGVLTIIR